MIDGLSGLIAACPRLPGIVCLVATGIMAAAPGAPAQEALWEDSAGTRAEAALEVEVVGGRIRGAARGVPLRRVLEEIVDQTDLLVVSRSPLERPVTLELDRVSLSDGLRRILRHEAFMLYEASASDRMPGRTSTLWIFAGDSAGRAGTGTITLRGLERGAPDVAGLEEKLLSDDVRVRQEAVKALRRIDPDLGLAALAQALVDPDEQVRVKAIYGLAAIGGEQAAGALTSALADSDPWVREEAAYALGVTDSETARQALRRALHDVHAAVRDTAIDAYAELGGGEAVNALAMSLEDTEAFIRLEAVEALRDLGGGPATRVLGKAVSHPDDEVRKAAIAALGELGKDEATRALADALDDPNTEVRKRAVEALGGIGSRAAQDLLSQVAAAEQDSSVREVATALLRPKRAEQ